MRPISSTTTDPTSARPAARARGPAVRGQARAAEVHALKAQGLSPSRKGWRDAAATPAVVVTLSAEATAALAAMPPVAPTEPATPTAIAPEAVVPTAAPTPPALLPIPIAQTDPTVAPEPNPVAAANVGTYLDIMVG